MRWFKKIVVSLLAIIVVAALLAIVTGNSHLFKAVATTYLVGKSGPSIAVGQ